jgi:hypothetical protein
MPREGARATRPDDGTSRNPPKEKNMTDLTAEAQAGWDSAINERDPYITTSPASDAWLVGKFLRINDAPRPEKASKGRGNSIRINGTHLFRLRYGAGATTIQTI